MKILVTGGAGFIGSHYVRTVLTGGYSGYEEAAVTVLDKLTYAGNVANLEPVAGKFTFVRGDICDGEMLREVLPGHDVVVNFAAETHVDRSIAGAAEFVTSNVTGVQVLLDACIAVGVPRIVHVSTDEVHGSIAIGSWTEASPLDPNSPYSAAKAGGDLLALAYARTHGVNVSITRCCNNYGPYQYPEKVIPLFATNLLDGKPVPLYGDGLNVRGWINVDDHCRGIQLVLERGEAGRVYNINGDVELSNRELTAAIRDACGVSWDMVVPVTDRKGHDRRYSFDDSLLRSMGYAPRVPFSDGLKATIEWYAGNRDWWEPLHRPAPPAGRRVTRWLITGAAGMRRSPSPAQAGPHPARLSLAIGRPGPGKSRSFSPNGPWCVPRARLFAPAAKRACHGSAHPRGAGRLRAGQARPWPARLRRMAFAEPLTDW